MRRLAGAQEISGRIDAARAAAGRGLAKKAGISQPTLSRIIAGDRAAKMPEIVALAWATGHTVAQLTGSVAKRIQFAERAASGPAMEQMRQTLQRYLELDEYLEDYSTPAGPADRASYGRPTRPSWPEASSAAV